MTTSFYLKNRPATERRKVAPRPFPSFQHESPGPISAYGSTLYTLGSTGWMAKFVSNWETPL
jgi:hypothetical protein